VVSFLEPIQARYQTIIADPAELARTLEAGADKAQAVAAKTLADVYSHVGFVPRGR
jgi:tryptophanyl-tRNA synthetase